MLVCQALMRSENTYFVFRGDGSQAEVVIRDGIIISENPKLTDEERQYFLDGKHKELKGN